MISKSDIVVRYAETDQMGIVHHSVYPVWFEVARTDFIKRVGMSYSEMERQGVLLPLVELGCRYGRAALYEDKLTIEVSIELLTPIKIKFLYRVFREGEGKPISTGFTLHAFTTKELRPVNIKKHFTAIYELIESAVE